MMDIRMGMILDADDLRQMLKDAGFSVALNGMMEHTAATIRMVQHMLAAAKKGIVEIDADSYDVEALKQFTLCQLDSLDHLVGVLKPADVEEEAGRADCLAAVAEMRAELLTAFED